MYNELNVHGCKAEIGRAYRVLPWYEAELQNGRDIQSWVGEGYVKPLEAKALFEYNARLAMKYEVAEKAAADA